MINAHILTQDGRVVPVIYTKESQLQENAERFPDIIFFLEEPVVKYLLISAGCAECAAGWDDEPLVEMKGPFDTMQEAKDAVWGGLQRISDDGWKPHPQGGVCYQDGQGMDWVFPVSDTFEVKPMPKGV